jgi:hypothetical protein
MIVVVLDLFAGSGALGIEALSPIRESSRDYTFPPRLCPTAPGAHILAAT